MVDLTKIPRGEDRTKLCACRIENKYYIELKKQKIRFTDFVTQALKETFPKL